MAFSTKCTAYYYFIERVVLQQQNIKFSRMEFSALIRFGFVRAPLLFRTVTAFLLSHIEKSICYVSMRTQTRRFAHIFAVALICGCVKGGFSLCTPNKHQTRKFSIHRISALIWHKHRICLILCAYVKILHCAHRTIEMGVPKWQEQKSTRLLTDMHSFIITYIH